MAYTRIYENIYSFAVQTPGPVLNENIKIFFNPCPEIKNRHIKAISISYYNSYAGQTDQAFITLKNSKGDILTYNYPAVDLQDTSATNVPGSINALNYKLRLFNFYDIDLASSYYFYNNLSGPLGVAFPILFYLNFYLD